MFGKKKQLTPPVAEEKKEKATPAYLRPDYPYKAVGEPITDLDSLDPDFVYEIKCNECEMSIRSLGVNIISTYERLKESGCKAELIRMDGMMHGFALYWQRFGKAKTMLDLIGSIVNGTDR